MTESVDSGREALCIDPWWTVPRVQACQLRTQGVERAAVSRQLGVPLSTLKDWEAHPQFALARQALIAEAVIKHEQSSARRDGLYEQAVTLLESRLKDALE